MTNPSNPIEAIIEPGLPIIDPHHHFFMTPIADWGAYPPDALFADLDSGHNIRATVYLEAHQFYDRDAPPHLQSVGEVREVNAIADQYSGRRICAGIIGQGDPQLGSAFEETLEASLAAAPNRFRGVRHLTAMVFNDWVDEMPLRMQPPYQSGLRQLARRGLIYETMACHPQLGGLAAIARANPDLIIVADHAGGPVHIGPYEGKETEVFDVWKAGMTELAAAPNVIMKLGGMNMHTTNFGWDHRGWEATSDEIAAKTAPYFHHAIEAFGPDRCMFESNFPVDRLAAGYATTWNAFKKIAAQYSPTEKAALFHDNAARVYRI